MESNTTQIKVVKDLDEISRMAAAEIVQSADRVGTSAGPFTIALSGGSTPGELYKLLAGEPTVRDRLPWDKTHFFWGDDRVVPPDHPQSNYRMARDTLFAFAPVPAQNIHRICTEKPDAALAAEKYEQELYSFFKLKAGQLPRFDCILLGMGSDGHTASLFPGTDALHEEKRLVAANWVEKLQTHRITMTVPVLNKAALIIFLVSGREKAEVLKEVLEGEFRGELLPAQLIRPDNGRLLWLVDQAAASSLTDSIRA
ncbi:MAG: 6-phosphogluconolactonase [Desulfobacterales bacterium]|nr:MAG: 6-phosphogluconolactonase [Desulfobacterales bacterium]